ncbi:hypothetical protein [Cupriavidus sp. UYPR2.512]|uniref:hypothetical protein n=1 Tax=Cupriavidus sp. UYPR2.512 TaxID=1080187 RepID=UPI00036C27DF|nr:hypothetical protein [Cupriavidus sp. UYPR2.512]UIF90848.1 hypothetical protein KAF44_32180 [Cupriavidus necator]
MRRYLWNLLIALDQGANAVLGGDPDETISSRAGKAMREEKRWGCVLCRFLNWFQADHCVKSIEPGVGANAALPD